MFKTWTLAGVVVLIVASSSCASLFNENSSSELITIIDQRRCGDKGGSFYYKEINKDSTLSIKGNYKDIDTLRYKTDSSKWDKLLKRFTPEMFNRLEAKPIGSLTADGCFSIFTYKTSDSIYRKSGIRFTESTKDIALLLSEM